MICKDCDIEFELFLVGVKRMNDVNLMVSQLNDDLDESNQMRATCELGSDILDKLASFTRDQ